METAFIYTSRSGPLSSMNSFSSLHLTTRKITNCSSYYLLLLPEIILVSIQTLRSDSYVLSHRLGPKKAVCASTVFQSSPSSFLSSLHPNILPAKSLIAEWPWPWGWLGLLLPERKKRTQVSPIVPPNNFFAHMQNAEVIGLRGPRFQPKVKGAFRGGRLFWFDTTHWTTPPSPTDTHYGRIQI